MNRLFIVSPTNYGIGIYRAYDLSDYEMVHSLMADNPVNALVMFEHYLDFAGTYTYKFIEQAPPREQERLKQVLNPQPISQKRC